MSSQQEIRLEFDDGMLWIHQDGGTGDDSDNDVVGVAAENVRRLIEAIQKVMTEAQSGWPRIEWPEEGGNA